MERAKGAREFQAASMGGHLLEDTEGANPLVVELLHGTLCRNIACIEPCKVVNLEGGRYWVAPVFRCQRVLFDGTRKLFPEVRVQGIEIRCHCGCFQRSSGVQVNVEGRMITFIRKEGGYACRGVRSIVVCEFREWKEGDPIVLLVVDVNPEVLFEYLIDAFGLSVCFRVICSRKVGLDA